MKINDNLLGLDFNHRFEKAVLLADAQYTYSAFNYYGLPATYQTEPEFDLIPPSYPDQVNNLLKIHTGIVSHENQKINYRLNVGYTLFKQKYADFINSIGRTENRILFDASLSKHINATTCIGMNGAMKIYSHHIPTGKEFVGDGNYVSFSANPYITFEGDTWDAHLGVKADIQFKSSNTKSFIPAPDIRFHWRPVSPILLYLTAEGGIKDNSNYTIFYENRYVDPHYRIIDSKSPFDGTLGIVFSPVIGLSIDLFTGYKWVMDEYFYYAYAYGDLFSGQKTLPQENDANLFKAGGVIKYRYQDLFDLNLKLVYNHWTVTSFEKINMEWNEQGAWNKPVFTGDWNMGLKIPDFPLRMDLTYHLETGRKALLYGIEAVSMKDIHHVNFATTYTLNKSLSVFAKANNLLFQKYDFWQGYPAQGFNTMIGVNYKF